MTDRFQTTSNLQGGFSKDFFPLITLFQLLMHLTTVYQINAKNTHVAENLQSIMQSIFPGVLKGKNFISVGTILEAQDLSLSATILTFILSAHHFS